MYLSIFKMTPLVYTVVTEFFFFLFFLVLFIPFIPPDFPTNPFLGQVSELPLTCCEILSCYVIMGNILNLSGPQFLHQQSEDNAITVLKAHGKGSVQVIDNHCYNHCYCSLGCCCLIAKLCLTLATPWTVAGQVSLSMGYSRQECWSGLPFPSLRDLPNPGTEPFISCLGRQILYHGATWEAPFLLG